MKTLYISLPSFRFWLLRVVVVVVLLLVERSVGFPILTFTAGLLIASKVAPVGGVIWLVLLGSSVAIVYQIPFWLPIGLLLVGQFVLEHSVVAWLKRELLVSMVALALIVGLILVAGMSVTGQLVLQLIVLALILGVIDQFQTKIGQSVRRATWLKWYEQHRD